MAGTILENLSNRKLFFILLIIFLFLFISFLVGAFIAPAPSNTEQVLATMCVPDDINQLAIPRDKIINREIARKNCHVYSGAKGNGPIVFAFQIPGPREGFALDYSRWMSYLIAMLVPEITYHNWPGSNPGHINVTLKMKVTLAARDVGNENWAIIATKDNLRRKLFCKLPAGKVEDGLSYDCDIFQLFELQSIFYDYYLINLQIPKFPDLFTGELTGLNLVAIHQNGGFTKVLLSMKTVFFFITLLTLLWYRNRVLLLGRKSTLFEKTLVVLGLAITQLNAPIEFLSLFFNLGFMNFLCDIRQGILYCTLLCFWRIFTGEHLLIGIQQSRLSLYYKDLSIILTASILLFVFDSVERGIQWIDPFFTIWEVDSNMAHIFIIAATLAAITYFIFLCNQIRLVRLNIKSKKTSLPAMSATRRLVYEGIIYRFNFLLVATIFSAGATLVAYILGQMGDSFLFEEDNNYYQLQWSSAVITFVYAMWNCYILILLILYAPSHKGRSSHLDTMSEEIEFNRLTSDDHQETNGDTSSCKDEKSRCSTVDRSQMQLLSEFAAHQSVD